MITKITFRHTKGNHPGLHDMALDTVASFNKYNDTIISTNVEFINEVNKRIETNGADAQFAMLKLSNGNEYYHKGDGSTVIHNNNGNNATLVCSNFVSCETIQNYWDWTTEYNPTTQQKRAKNYTK